MSTIVTRELGDNPVGPIGLTNAQIDQNFLNLNNDKAEKSELGSLAGQDKVSIADIDATGTPDSTTALHGDGQWKTAGAGDMKKAENLAGLADVSVARMNLGLGTAATKDVPTSGNATTMEIVRGDDTRLSDARVPTAHNHAWDSITAKPVVIAAGADQAAARTAIGALADAPSDGKQYARKDAAWSEVESSGSGYETGDLRVSVAPTGLVLPDWLPCNGALVSNANAPSKLLGSMVRVSGIDDSLDSGDMSGPPPAALTHVPYFDGEWVVCRLSATPFLHIQKVSTAGSTAYENTSFNSGQNPSVALPYVALKRDGGPEILAFTGGSGGVYNARYVTGWSAYSQTAKFSGISCNGVVCGADKKFYYTRTTAPFLERIGGSQTVNASEREAVGGGITVAPSGIAISPNMRYMVVWCASAPYIYAYEWNGTRYVAMGSPPSGAAALARLDVADDGTFLGRPSSGSVVYVGRILTTGVSAVLATTVAADTVWGLSSDGRDYIAWNSTSAMKRYPIVDRLIDIANSAAMPQGPSGHTVYDRIQSVPGKFFAPSSRSYYFCWHAEATPSGWYAPEIPNTFIKT